MADEDLMDFQTQVNDIDEKLKQISDDYNPHSNNSFAKVQRVLLRSLLSPETFKLKVFYGFVANSKTNHHIPSTRCRK